MGQWRSWSLLQVSLLLTVWQKVMGHLTYLLTSSLSSSAPLKLATLLSSAPHTLLLQMQKWRYWEPKWLAQGQIANKRQCSLSNKLVWLLNPLSYLHILLGKSCLFFHIYALIDSHLFNFWRATNFHHFDIFLVMAGNTLLQVTIWFFHFEG